jgi:hypothetical protein
MVAEGTQDVGRVAAALTKRWLESTTYIELPWNAYKHGPMCTVQCLDGSTKTFDLSGFFLDDQTPLMVESKGVQGAQDQYLEYRKFLAIAYSSTVREIDARQESKRHFIWATTHPFGFSKDWAQLETHTTVREAVEEFPALLPDREPDEDILRTVAQRIWLLVRNRKQERVFLTPEEVGQVHTLLKRKESSL